MGRVHLFGFGDLGWFPQPLRGAGTDFLRFSVELGNPYQ
jgi:hypothetical protein